MKINGKTTSETKTIDSIGYTTQHQSTKKIFDEIETISIKLTEKGYINNQIIKKNKENDSIYTAIISLKKKIKHIHIYIGTKNKPYVDFFNEPESDSITLPYTGVKAFLEHTLQNLETKGYAFSKVQLINFQQKEQNLYADLSISVSERRRLSNIEIKYSNPKQKKLFPKGAEKQIDKKYKNNIFNQEIVKQIYNDFEKFSFIKQVKPPEILFTKDTSKVFVYLEKRKANNFDGYLGFNNTENKKIRFNGYLNLTLVNTLKYGEEITIYWKNNGNNQRQFDASLNIPYLFNSPITLKGLINIFKQDSIFQNTKTSLQIGYLLNYNKRLYLGYESTESSDIQNLNTQNLTDYKNTFYTASIEFKKNNSNNELIPVKSSLDLNIGTGKRTTTSNSSLTQNFVNFNIMNNFYISKKNIVNIKSQNYFLKSKNYIINELYRFGGINSVRGFSENSLQANLMIALITEYRYLISSNLYFNSILDYCYSEDPITLNDTQKNNQLLGIGLGLGAITANGLLKFTITNGKTTNEEIKFYNTNITISYNVKF
ncbi:hypothetical protein [Flavobacterium adhaerens]|uniref:hypothetical protein n=1 Tax=Flavobacterium adhaerens TaxID=3149043 RepID=UPI0032B3793B